MSLMSKDLFANMDEPSFTRRKFPQLEEEKREAELIEQAKENNNLITLPITQLVMDPDNESIFGKIELGSIVNFSSEIEHNGFKGAIMAYPIDTDDGKKYQIESGHRRFLAAKEAGLEELPVIVTEPPLSDTERKIRLIDMNMQNRDLKPSVLANVASVLLDNITAEEEKNGVPAKKDLVYGLVARKMNTSSKTIYRYQSLNKLIPKLKEFADEGVSWTALTQAAKLPEDKQELIALAISNELVENQAENITRPWIISLIARTSGQTDEPKSKTIVRSRSGAKIISKCAKDFDYIFSGNATFKDSEKKQAFDDLVELRDKLNKKISELGNEIF